MDFVEKEFIFVSYVWLSLGTLGVIIEPYPDNKAVLVGTKGVSIACYSTATTNVIDLKYQSVGDNFVKSAKTTESKSFTGLFNAKNGSYIFTIKNASMLMAGTYSCVENTRVYVQIIVLSDNPTCNLFPIQTKQLLCNDTITLSCSVSYTANWTYVVPNLKWTTDASPSQSLQGSVYTSRSGNITTATSTLKVTWPVDSPGAIPVYSCNTTFGVVDGLSKEFVTQPPDYNYLCKPFTSPDDAPCIKVERKNNYATTVTPDNSTDLAEKRKEHGDTTDGSSFASSDTNIVLLTLCVAGSLLLAQEFEENLH